MKSEPKSFSGSLWRRKAASSSGRWPHQEDSKSSFSRNANSKELALWYFKRQGMPLHSHPKGSPNTDPWNSPFNLRSKSSEFLNPLKCSAGLALFSTDNFAQNRRTQVSVTAEENVRESRRGKPALMGHCRGSRPSLLWPTGL